MTLYRFIPKAAGAAGLALAYLLQSGFVRLQYPDSARYPVRGIDVSHHQGAIDWSAVGREGMVFAYMKASEGADMKDPRFEENWRGAQQAGLAPGAYHYFSCELDAFSLLVKSQLGAAPIVYVTESFWQSYHDALPPELELWVRSVVFGPESSFGGAWRLWQFAGHARVAGVQGPVDLDAFNGSEADWRLYLRARLKLKPDAAAGVDL
ncbi:MAG: GH25 family lysozyme [Elusimicrobia bacterium]|nr:GH25 family lysozyme [Elusimicrobiota bacterium]